MDNRVGPRIAQSLGVILQRSFRAGFYDPVTDEVGGVVDSATYPVLSAVDRIGPSSAAALGAELGLDRSVVSRRASCLVGAGLLSGIDDPADARATLLSLTVAGQQVVVRTQNRLAALMDARVADWEPNDQNTFAELLARFAGLGAPPAPARAPSMRRRRHTESGARGTTS
jgi:DNA-binding MarR family transcriptional regulator